MDGVEDAGCVPGVHRLSKLRDRVRVQQLRRLQSKGFVGEPPVVEGPEYLEEAFAVERLQLLEITAGVGRTSGRPIHVGSGSVYTAGGSRTAP